MISSERSPRRPARRRHQPALNERTARQVSDILARLPGVSREVVDLRFGLSGGHPMSRADVGRQLGMTHREVAAIEQRGLEHLRETVDQAALGRLLAKLTG